MLRQPFFSAPHRVMFVGGVVQSVIAMLLWLIDVGARYAGLWGGWAWMAPPAWVHAALMLYGVFPFFVFGFLMTTFPKWTGVEALIKRQYLSPFVTLVIGWAVFYGGFSDVRFYALGLAVVTFGWVQVIRVLWKTARKSATGGTASIPEHQSALLVALAAGAAGVAAMSAAFNEYDGWLAKLGIDLGLWGCLLPIFVIVSHRMLPVFSAAAIPNYVVYRSLPVLWVVLAAFAAYLVFDLLALEMWLWAPDLVAAAGVTVLVVKWQLRRSFVSRLLATHHLAALWLIFGLLIDAAQSLTIAAGGPPWGGLAPLHAIALGYFGSMVIGMITRVTLGHSGRMISEDRVAWPLFWGLQLVTVLRLAADFSSESNAFNPLVWASVGWLLVFAAWAIVHLPMLLTRRPDGRPG